ncbi:acyltransferase family protein [Streptomyces sp. NPDC053474]|uniref:acyltransferase family protein n=1 Tax=Streptomyces sp. NPDC053474 TaxID=3365704 RepID=UPI0037D15D8F
MADLAYGTAYRATLDGLRALAVLSVVLFHAELLPWGWVGVPLFFTLSGHFITLTLLKDPGAGRAHRAGSFARNRALRLAPLYVTFCAVLTVLAAVDYGDGSLARNLPYFWTWSFDLSTMAHDFTPTSLQLYTHLWSLCVEVQIYVLWAVAAIWLPRRWFVRTVVALALAGPLLRVALWIFLTRTGYPAELRPTALYTSPATYVDAFALGALTALPELRRRLRAPARWVPAVFAAVTAATVLRELAEGHGFLDDLGYPILLADHHGWIWKYTVLGLFFAAVVLVLADRGEGGVRLLGRAPLVRVGVISYGVYVLHLPLLGQIQRWQPSSGTGWSRSGLLAATVLLAGSVLAAEVSYRFLERPFLRRKRDALLR